ncbi:MAG: hypothetical protein ACTSYH_03625 [Candidatus Heimdallarchaeaceae archaeon]
MDVDIEHGPTYKGLDDFLKHTEGKTFHHHGHGNICHSSWRTDPPNPLAGVCYPKNKIGKTQNEFLKIYQSKNKKGNSQLPSSEDSGFLDVLENE